MFLGIEVGVLVGAGLGLITGGSILLFLRERKERQWEKSSAAAWRQLSDDLLEEQRAHRAWQAHAEEADRQLNEAYGEQAVLRTQLEEADEALDLACEDLADAEEEIKKLEEESDGFEESAVEAFEQLTIANDLVKHTLAWSERVLDVLERFEEEHR